MTYSGTCRDSCIYLEIVCKKKVLRKWSTEMVDCKQAGIHSKKKVLGTRSTKVVDRKQAGIH